MPLGQDNPAQVDSLPIRLKHTPAICGSDVSLGDDHGFNKRRTGVLRWARQAGELVLGDVSFSILGTVVTLVALIGWYAVIDGGGEHPEFWRE